MRLSVYLDNWDGLYRNRTVGGLVVFGLKHDFGVIYSAIGEIEKHHLVFEGERERMTLAVCGTDPVL